MSIKARLLLTISALIATAFLVIGVVTVSVTEDRMVARVDESLRGSPRALARFWEGGDGGGGGPNRGEGAGEFGNRETAILLLDRNGTVIHSEPSGYAASPDPLPDISATDVAERANEVFVADAVADADLRYRVLLRPVGDGFVLATAAPLDDVESAVRNLTIVISLTAVAVLVLIVFVVWLIIRHSLQPIDNMIGTAGLIAAGDLSHRVEYDDVTTEVGQLGQALNEMLGQIETSFAAKAASEQRLRRFVADASHELRTPLTSIRGYAELYRSGATATPEGLERVMARIETEGARMGKLVEDLLLLARLDQGRPLQREPVDLSEIVEHAVMDARVVEPGRTIDLDTSPDAVVLGDADRLRQVIDNFLSNARMHTDPAAAVRVRVAADDRHVTLSVADEGPGIAPEHAEHVFDRFYRVDPSRVRASGGTGLGLSIVALIVAAHGGSIALDTAPGAGATFTVTLDRLHQQATADVAMVASGSHSSDT